jgi:hypothetical protein
MIIILTFPVLNKEDIEHLFCDDEVLEEALLIDLQEYEGEIFLHERNIIWCEEATYVALYEDELGDYGIFLQE